MKKLSRIQTFFDRFRPVSPTELALHHLYHLIHHLGDAIMAKLSDATTRLNALADQMTKVKAEVQALKDASENMDTTPEFDASLDRLGGLIQGTDDIDPDAPAAGGDTPSA